MHKQIQLGDKIIGEGQPPYKEGDITQGYKVGYKSPQRLIYSSCADCGKSRWVAYIHGEPVSKRCWHCASKKYGYARMGENHGHWKGGRKKEGKGYISILLRPDDFFYPMAHKNGYVDEHRLVMAKHLGRLLQPFEIVHHKNGKRNDNRLENLELCTNGQHSLAHSKGYTDGYEKGYYDGMVKFIYELLMWNE